MEEISQVIMRNINLIPFKEAMILNGKLELSEIIYNILVIVPLGVYVQIFKSDWVYKNITSFCIKFYI